MESKLEILATKCHNRNIRVSIRENDDPEKVAKEVSKVHGLSIHIQTKLKELLSLKLSQCL